MIKKLRPHLLPLLAMLGCGGISDPTKNTEHTATVTGALTGTNVPANARVAFLWKKGEAGGIAVAADVPVVNGKFTMDIVDPQDAYFFATDSEQSVDSTSGNAGSVGNGSTGGSAPDPSPAPSPSPSGARQLQTKDLVSGTTISGDLKAAVGGFIVYEDTNGNGQLDFDDQAKTTDTVIGGNKELMIVDLRGGSSLDYEKLRDKSGILPAEGLNLYWTEERWLGLNLVELKINDAGRLPSPVCVIPGTSMPLGDSQGGTDEVIDAGPPSTPQCSADGRSYTYTSTCPPTIPEPRTLCNAGDSPIVNACAPSYGQSLLPGEPVPAGWPCDVLKDGGVDAGDEDGGEAPDAGK